LACVGGICAIWAPRVAPSNNQKPTSDMSLQAPLCPFFLAAHVVGVGTVCHWQHFLPPCSFLVSPLKIHANNAKFQSCPIIYRHFHFSPYSFDL